MSEIIQKRLKTLERLDKSVHVKHLPRSQWPEAFIKGKTLLWQVPRTTAQFIFCLAQFLQPRSIMEWGTSGGYSTLWLHFASPRATIHTIEFSDYRADIARQTFKQTSTEQYIHLFQGKIVDFLQEWSQPIDLLFIDADKPRYLSHFKQVERFLTRGSLVIADNILDNPQKVADFTISMQENPQFTTQIINMDNGLLVAKKK